MLDFTLRPCDCLTSETSENRARRPSQIYNRVKGNVFKTLRPTAAEQWKMFWEKRVQRPGLPSSLRLAKGKAIPGDFRLTANTFVVCDVTAHGLCMRTEKKPQHTQNDRYHGSRNNKTIRRTGPLLSSRSLVRFRKTCKFSYKYTIPTLLLVYLTIPPHPLSRDLDILLENMGAGKCFTLNVPCRHFCDSPDTSVIRIPTSRQMERSSSLLPEN